MTIREQGILDAEAFGGTSIGVEIAVDGAWMRVGAETAIGFGHLLITQGEHAIELRDESMARMRSAFANQRGSEHD